MGRMGGSESQRRESTMTRRRDGHWARHHSSLATGLALNGDCDGNERLEQFGPEHGRPGAGAQGERPAPA